MNTWGPIGMVLSLAVTAFLTLATVALVGLLWQLGNLLATLGWPLILVMVALAGTVAWWYRLARPLPALPPARLPVEVFCDQCGSQLVAGCCLYCDEV